jgi:hypothetical protein
MKTIRKVIQKLDLDRMEFVFQAPPAETCQVVSVTLSLGDTPALENFLVIRIMPAAQKIAGADFILIREDMNGKSFWFWQPTGLFLAGGDEIKGILADPTDLDPVWLEMTLRAV